jgi:hypothetical protein
LSLLIESGRPSPAVPVVGSRGSRLRRVLDRYDVMYVVPVLIAVAAFILAVLAYFR